MLQKFFVKCFAMGCLGLMLLVVAHVMVYRYDFFYQKFIGRADSLIVGSSLALGGLKTEILAQALPESTPMLNFAFTMAISPYSELYATAIRTRVDENAKHGLYILEVSPLSLAEVDPSQANALGAGITFDSEDHSLLKIRATDLPLNVEYLLMHARKPLLSNFVGNALSSHLSLTLPAMGWRPFLEPSAPAKDSEALPLFDGIYRKSVLSKKRLGTLREIVGFLRAHGRVVLVRLPITAGMKALETKYYPDFSNLLVQIAFEERGEFVDMFGFETLEFADVHHLNPRGAELVSTALVNRLRTVGIR